MRQSEQANADARTWAGGIYWMLTTLVAGLAFFGAWGYAAVSWGLLLGVGLGWIPALVIGALAGLLWPLLLGVGLLFAAP